MSPKWCPVCGRATHTPHAVAEDEGEHETSEVVPTDSEAITSTTAMMVPVRKKNKKPPVKATDINKHPTERQLLIARTKMIKVMLPAHQEDWAGPILHAFPTLRKLALASRAAIGGIKKGKNRVVIEDALANRIYRLFH